MQRNNARSTLTAGECTFKAALRRLKRRSVRYHDYVDSADPPVLHRKELFVDTSYPKRSLFERLTRQEERLALLDEPANIGTRSRWNARLSARQLKIVGHRVQRLTARPAVP